MSVTPPTQSDGPDRFKNHVTCFEHQNNTRTGIKDYMCCCNPCSYRTFREALGDVEHCCRCNPIMIIVVFEPDEEGDDCCMPRRLPVFARHDTLENGKEFVSYSGNIYGYNFKVALSIGSISETNQYGEDYDERPCYWTVSFPELGVWEEIEIDHETVTCLGVPEFSIENVPINGECFGTIYLDDFETVKLPFYPRVFSLEDYPEEGLSVTVPHYCDNCDEVARYLCVFGALTDGGNAEAVEFVWDFAFVQTQTPYGFAVGRWVEIQPRYGEYERTIYLFEDSYGNCQLYFDFVASAIEDANNETEAAAERADELFAPLTLTGPNGCACGIRESVGPIEHTVIAGFTMQTGRCGCWGYLCGKCRCLPQSLCVFAFIGQVFYKNIQMLWDADVGAWISVGGTGVDIDGNVFTETLLFQLRANEKTGGCEVVFERDGFEFEPHPLTCEQVMSVSFSAAGEAADDFVFVLGVTAFGPCDQPLFCNGVLSCVLDCGAPPRQLRLEAEGWSDPYEDEPGLTDTCFIEADLFLIEIPGLIGGDPNPELEIYCYYFGIQIVECDDWTYRFEFTLLGGVLSIARIRLDTGDRHTTSFVLDEECSPYLGSYFNVTGITDCFWSCSASVSRLRIDITEV